MITLLMVLLPLLIAACVWLIGNRLKQQIVLLNLGAVINCIGTLLLWFRPQWDECIALNVKSLIGQDFLSRTVVSIVSLLFLLASLQTVKYFPMVRKRFEQNAEKFLSPRVVAVCLLGFLSSMTLVASSRNFGLLWVAMEATTLASAPLIIFRRTGTSLEAMWKYILLCSVGIGFALFGTMLLAIAGEGSHAGMDMQLWGMSDLNPGWFKAAFVFILAGYGTKMGLAPFQAWMPDAYSEAPGVLSVLSSGALLACSFLGIVRVLDVSPAEVRPFCVNMMLILGMFSLALAALFILRQSDYKRMLAYSSMEHMGLCAMLWALGLEGAALLHLVTHALVKVVLFMTADNIQLACGTQKIKDISGLLGITRRNAVVYLVSMLMLCGMPPSPLFVSELLLVRAAGPLLGGIILLLLFMVFAGMTFHAMRMVMGAKSLPAAGNNELKALENLSFIPACVLTAAVIGGAVLIFGIIGIEFKFFGW